MRSVRGEQVPRGPARPRAGARRWMAVGGASLALAIGTAGAARAAAPATAAPATLTPPPGTLSTAPVAIVVPATAGALYLPLALTWRLRPGLEVLVEGALAWGAWLGCGSRSTGGWASVGLVRIAARGTGPLVALKLTGRVFDTRGGTASGWFGCGGAEVAMLQGTDGEVGLGVDLGWRLAWRRLVVEPRLGIGLAACVHCVGGSAFFVGPVALGGDRMPRSTRATLTLDVELLHVGVRF